MLAKVRIFEFHWDKCTAEKNSLSCKVASNSSLKHSIACVSFLRCFILPKYCAKDESIKLLISQRRPRVFHHLTNQTTTEGPNEEQHFESSLFRTNDSEQRLSCRRLSEASFLRFLPLGNLFNLRHKLLRNMVVTTLFSQFLRYMRSQLTTVQHKISASFSLFLHLAFNKTISVMRFKIQWFFVKRTFMSEAFLFCLLCSSFDKAGGAKQSGFNCKSVTAGQACLPKEYSKYELPNPSGVNPIKFELLIQEVLRINDKDYSITFSCYYNIYWPDTRIRLSKDFGKDMVKDAVAKNPDFNITMNPDVLVPMNLEMIKDLWLPDILIYNLKTFKVMDVLSKLAGLWISADYQILYSTSTHITFICPMHFDKFPLDTQSCKFQIGSYSYDDSQMTFETIKAAYDGKTQNSIALDYAIEIRPLSPKDSILLFDGLGNFSLAGFELVLNRYVSTYIITYYLPSGLFVIVSWISFLIPMDVIPGRMALLVTLFLVLVNIFNNVTTNTPKAEGLTAIEAWMLACILFVFGALIE